MDTNCETVNKYSTLFIEDRAIFVRFEQVLGHSMSKTALTMDQMRLKAFS